MSSSIEEELGELLRHRFIWPPRKFEERRLFNIENPREFREKYRLPVEAFEYLLAAVGQQLEHKTKRNRALTARLQLWCFSTSLAQTLFIMLCTRVHGIATSTRGTQRICSFKYLFLGRLPAGWQIIFV